MAWKLWAIEKQDVLSGFDAPQVITYVWVRENDRNTPKNVIRNTSGKPPGEVQGKKPSSSR